MNTQKQTEQKSADITEEEVNKTLRTMSSGEQLKFRAFNVILNLWIKENI